MIKRQIRETYREEIERGVQEKFKAEAPALVIETLIYLLKLPYRKRPKEINEILSEFSE